MKLRISFYVLMFFCVLSVAAQNEKTIYDLKKDISYITDKDEKVDPYRSDRCRLDVYYPTNKKGFSTIVWFHGGGLEGGEKEIIEGLKDKGFAIVGVNYRLSPKANHPAYIEDAAEAVAWAFKNIESCGGSVDNIYVSGHSAGGYLALMLALDKSYLNHYGIDADKVKGYAPISGQTLTHYTIRKELNIPQEVPLADSYAPLNQVRRDVRPILLITGDRHLEMTARYEENVLLEAVLKSLGNKDVMLYEMQGFNHGTVVYPACFLITEWINKLNK